MSKLISFFQPARLLEMRPYSQPQTLKIMLVFFVLLSLVAIVIKLWEIYQQPTGYQKKLADKYLAFFSWLSFFGLFIVLARHERAPFISARFWLIIWLIIAIYWLYSIIKYQIKVVPEAQKQIEQKNNYKNIYLRKNESYQEGIRKLRGTISN